MRTKHLLHALAALSLFASCKKSSNSNSVNKANNFKSYVEEVHAGGINQTDSFNLTYDNDGRMTSLVSPTQKFLYSYNGNSTITMDYYENGQLSIHEIGYLKNGLLDSTLQYNDSQDTTTEGYVYTNNQLTRKTTYDYLYGYPVVDFVNDYSYALGTGLVNRDVQSSGGMTTSTTTYTYIDASYQMPAGPFAVSSQLKNLLATQTISDAQGNVTATITYTYLYDSSNRVTQETDTQDNGDYVVKRYHY